MYILSSEAGLWSIVGRLQARRRLAISIAIACSTRAQLQGLSLWRRLAVIDRDIMIYELPDSDRSRISS